MQEFLLNIFPVCVFAPFILTIVFGFLLFNRIRQNRVLNALSKRLPDGKMVDGGLFGNPKVTFQHNHGAGEVRFQNTGNDAYWVRCILRIRQPMPKVAITPQGFFSEIFAGIGFQQDIQIGQGAFDSQFIIKGQPQSGVKQVLTPECQTHIRGLDSNFQSFQLSNKKLAIQRTEWFKNVSLAADFVERCVACLDAVIDAQRAPFDELATSRGLTLSHDDEANSYELIGRVDAASIHLRYTPNTGALHLHTSPKANIGNTMRLQIMHAKHAKPLDGAETLSLNNPVLDQMISVKTNHNPDGLIALFNQANLADVLLPIVHAHPKSHITEREIKLEATKQAPKQIGERLDEVLAAHRQLKTALEQWANA